MTGLIAPAWRLIPPSMRANDRYNLAESTVRSLRLAELLALAREDGGLDDLAMDYGDPAGTPALRHAIGSNLDVSPEWVVTVPGTMLGLYFLAAEICCGGDAVLVTPCFGPMRAAIERAGARVQVARLRFENGYVADVARIAAALRPGTRLVVLSDPGNPSGVHVPRMTIEALLVEMARRCPDAVLFIDETYREATHGGAAPPSAAGLDPRVCVAGSLSKAHGAPGLRIGWITIPDPALRARVIAAKEALIIAGSTLDEALAVVLLRRADAVLTERRHALGAALDAVLRWQETEIGRLEIVRPNAGALCCLRLRARQVDSDDVDRFWAALPGERLRLAPGSWFGEEERVFRLGFGHLPTDELGDALSALSRALDAAA